MNHTFFLSAIKIRARHHLILPAIGAHPREQQSYDLATALLYATPCAVFTSAILDQILITVYMNWVHPWRGIVQNHPKEGTENKNDQLNLEHAMEDMIPLVTLNIIQDGANREDDNQPERPQE